MWNGSGASFFLCRRRLRALTGGASPGGRVARRAPAHRPKIIRSPTDSKGRPRKGSLEMPVNTQHIKLPPPPPQQQQQQLRLADKKRPPSPHQQQHQKTGNQHQQPHRRIKCRPINTKFSRIKERIDDDDDDESLNRKETKGATYAAAAAAAKTRRRRSISEASSPTDSISSISATESTASAAAASPSSEASQASPHPSELPDDDMEMYHMFQYYPYAAQSPLPHQHQHQHQHQHLHQHDCYQGYLPLQAAGDGSPGALRPSPTPPLSPPRPRTKDCIERGLTPMRFDWVERCIQSAPLCAQRFVSMYCRLFRAFRKDEEAPHWAGLDAHLAEWFRRDLRAYAMAIDAAYESNLYVYRDLIDGIRERIEHRVGEFVHSWNARGGLAMSVDACIECVEWLLDGDADYLADAAGEGLPIKLHEALQSYVEAHASDDGPRADAPFAAPLRRAGPSVSRRSARRDRVYRSTCVDRGWSGELDTWHLEIRGPAAEANRR